MFMWEESDDKMEVSSWWGSSETAVYNDKSQFVVQAIWPYLNDEGRILAGVESLRLE